MLSKEPDIVADGERRDALDHNCGSTPETETAIPGLAVGDRHLAGGIGSDHRLPFTRKCAAGLNEDGGDAVALRDLKRLAFVAGLEYTVHQLTVAQSISHCKRIHLPSILPRKC